MDEWLVWYINDPKSVNHGRSRSRNKNDENKTSNQKYKAMK